MAHPPSSRGVVTVSVSGSVCSAVPTPSQSSNAATPSRCRSLTVGGVSVALLLNPCGPAVKNAAALARRKREEAAKKKDGSSSDSYDSESEDSENDNDRGFIDNNGVDKGELNETRFYNGKRDERPEPRRSRKPKDALDEAMERLKKPKNKMFRENMF